jgi:hypothetical protein
MKLAGKYAYTPDFFPNQQLMHSLANQTNNTQLREALLDFQYPFRLEDLKSSGYSPEIMQTVLNAVTGTA